MPLPNGRRILRWLTAACYLSALGTHGALGAAASDQRKCRVWRDSADCSHMSLSEIPRDLPGNITRLDVSHNRLTGLRAASLAPYAGLLNLEAGYNSVTKLDVSMCQTLPLLRTLNLERNQVHRLSKEDLSSCGALTVLNMASNRLADVSHAGNQTTAPRLVSLTLSENAISTLQTDDFNFLSRSPSLRVLNMLSLPLKKVLKSGSEMSRFEDGCFKPIANITFLNMDGCNLGTRITQLCTELSETLIRTLSLRDTNLGKLTNKSSIWKRIASKHLTNFTFQGLRGLKVLNLRRALVKSQISSMSIDDFAFNPLVALESLMLEHNAFPPITENMFTATLHGLVQLHITQSYHQQTFVSLAASPLRLVNLTGTAISKINPGAFSAFPNLTTLLLDYNFIRQILTGEEFEGLDQLEQLFFSNNHQMALLSSGSFVQVPRLRILTLSKSVTGTLDIDPSPFGPLTNLNVLDLSNNNIANINARLLNGLANLTVLKMQHNNLARMWKTANIGGPVLFLKDLGNLTMLNMDYSGLDEIPIDALAGLKKLKVLNFTGNILNNLRDSVFQDLLSLQELNLEKNLITAVRPQVFKPAMENLRLLDMGRNPFDCTCESILWFVTWLNTTNTSVTGGKDQFTCNTPLIYFNRSVMDFDPLSCKDATPFEALYILSSTVVIAVMFVAFLVRFQGWRIQFYWNVLINRTLGFSDAKVEEGREFEYDAYVIHTNEDRKWVNRSLLPLEKEKYVFCMENRDFLPGTSHLEAIVDNMKKSRKILFVVTDSLLKDHWFKAHHALHQVMEASRDSVILVFLQDVHDHRLSRSLFLRRGMLRPQCLLYWPVHQQRVPAFHEKLRIALGTTNALKP
ncbi:hypothetical protein CRUP_017496 [Coryphaenoides rupestris]|nr:hypothetical protein CRUP_017496 [Coryphaenoides rupestris]